MFNRRPAGTMNFASLKTTNYIFTSLDNEDMIEDFIKIAAKLLKEKKTVLLFTCKHVDFMHILAGHSKEEMQNFIISYHSNVNGIIDKLLELHDWTILPNVVIVNLNSFFDVANTEPHPTLKNVCFCISSLFSYMKSIEERKRGTNQYDVAHSNAKSISLLNAHRDVQIQLIIDFYFYKMAAFSELDVIKCEILN